MSAIELIKSSPLFHDLYEDEIELIVKACEVLFFKPEEKIINDGDEGTEIFIVLKGMAEVRKTLPDGKVIKISVLHEGDMFGETSLIDEPRTADVIALTNCDVLSIYKEDLLGLYPKKAKIFSVLALNMARLLAKRLKTANQKIN